MGWFDDLQARVNQEKDKTLGDIQSYIQARVPAAVVKIGQEQLGNLSQKELDAGKAGAAPLPSASVNGAAGLNAISASQIGNTLGKYLPMIAIAGAAYYFFNARKSRG